MARGRAALAASASRCATGQLPRDRRRGAFAPQCLSLPYVAMRCPACSRRSSQRSPPRRSPSCDTAPGPGSAGPRRRRRLWVVAPPRRNWRRPALWMAGAACSWAARQAHLAPLPAHALTPQFVAAAQAGIAVRRLQRGRRPPAGSSAQAMGGREPGALLPAVPLPIAVGKALRATAWTALPCPSPHCLWRSSLLGRYRNGRRTPASNGTRDVNSRRSIRVALGAGW